MARVYNFSAGPAMLPIEVLQEAADEKRHVCHGNEPSRQDL